MATFLLINVMISLRIFWAVNSVLVFILSAFCAGVLIPQILLIAFRKKLFDIPDERKIHQCLVPRFGGIAFKPVIFFSVAFLLGFSQLIGYGNYLEEIKTESLPLTFGFCSIMILYLVGMADDLIGIRYRIKFVIQIICGLMVVAGGLWVNDLHGLMFIHALPQWLGYLVTIFVTVFIINAINLIDGIDGLASGLCGLAMLFYGLIFFFVNEYIYAILAFATLGVLIPFFYYNVFGDAVKRKKIFMGDTGSLTIGMMICVLSLKLLNCFPENLSNSLPDAFVLAYSPLIIPCFDVVRVYLHRVRNGKNPFLPDKNHIHHKMLAIGMKQHTAMITIVFVSACFSIGNIFLSKYIDPTLILVLDILIWTIGNLWLTYKIKTVKSKL